MRIIIDVDSKEKAKLMEAIHLTVKEMEAKPYLLNSGQRMKDNTYFAFEVTEKDLWSPDLDT